MVIPSVNNNNTQGIIPGPSPKEARLLEIKCPFYDLNWEFIPPDYIGKSLIIFSFVFSLF
jgi:hypothetical protein